MKNGLTELIFVFDRSGSMSGKTQDTIGGFNTMIEKQRKEEGECLVSLVVFDHESKVIFDRVPIGEVRPLTEEDCSPRGTTALLDAVGGAIHHIGNVHKYARDEDRPEKTLVVITTDGYENASENYTKSRVREMISRQTEKYHWEFIYLGADINSVEAAESIGIRRERVARYNDDKVGRKAMNMSLCEAVRSVRVMDHVSEDWCASIDMDMVSRKKPKA